MLLDAVTERVTNGIVVVAREQQTASLWPGGSFRGHRRGRGTPQIAWAGTKKEKYNPK
jgi:hypothetical protein